MKATGLSGIKQAELIGVMCLFTIACLAGYNDTEYNDIVDDIAASVKSGNTKELSKHFSSTVSMTLLDDEGIYSRVQAEIILRDFFSKHAPVSVKIAHRIDSNPNFRYVVLNLETSKGKFRVSYKLTNNDNTFQITEFRIESI